MSPQTHSVSITGCGRSQEQAGRRCPLVAASQHCRHETEESRVLRGARAVTQRDSREPEREAKASHLGLLGQRVLKDTEGGGGASAREASCKLGARKTLSNLFPPEPRPHTQVHTDQIREVVTPERNWRQGYERNLRKGTFRGGLASQARGAATGIYAPRKFPGPLSRCPPRPIAGIPSVVKNH